MNLWESHSTETALSIILLSKGMQELCPKNSKTNAHIFDSVSASQTTFIQVFYVDSLAIQVPMLLSGI